MRIGLLALLTVAVAVVDRPEWPAQWHADIIEVRRGGLTRQGNTTGSWFYDSVRGAFRVDRGDMGRWDQLCSGAGLGGRANASCVNLAARGARFIYSSDLSAASCCVCCTDAQGCGPVEPSWVSSATLVASEPGGLDHVPARKWLVEGVSKNYLWTAVSDGALLALQQGDPHDPFATDTDFFVRGSLRNGSVLDPSIYEPPAFCPPQNATTDSELCPGFCAVLRHIGRR